MCVQQAIISSKRESILLYCRLKHIRLFRASTLWINTMQPCWRFPPNSATSNNKIITCCHLLKKMCFDPHNIFTHPYPKTKICFISTPAPSSCIIFSWKYASIPTSIISHPNEKYKTCFVKKLCFSLILISKQKTASFNLHQTSRQLPSRACKKQQQIKCKQFPHLLMICFGRHTIFTYPLFMETCFNPHRHHQSS
mgnify:CR=1 FL=1